MTKEQMLENLTELSRQYHCFDDEDPWDYAYEKGQIIDEWDNLVPSAEKLGISHKYMKHIWQKVWWDTYEGDE